MCDFKYDMIMFGVGLVVFFKEVSHAHQGSVYLIIIIIISVENSCAASYFYRNWIL